MSSTYWRRLEEERKRKEIAIQNSWLQKKNELQERIDCIKSNYERKRLVKSLLDAEQPYIKAMSNDNFSLAENLINQLRQNIISTQTDERLIASKQNELSKFLSELERKAPVGFVNNINAIREDDIKPNLASLEEQNKKLRALTDKAQSLAGEISIANSISIDGLVEEKFIILPVAVVDKAEKEAAEKISLLQDISDFGGRVAFFSEYEAEKLKSLITEAKNDTGISRLRLIRTQVKTTYNRLREQAVLTDTFKQSLNDFLPSIRRARNTEYLCNRIEDLLRADVISRDDYDEVYKAVKIVLSEQSETIEDAFFAEKIASTLNEMGYNLIDENGNPAELPPNTMRMIETPYDGYRVRVKVGRDNSVVTRLVRVVGSEEEKSAISEYQRQKDIETGKKWCKDLKKFYKALEDDGLQMKDVMRKEPGEEALDVIIDKSVQKTRRTSTAEHQQEILQERKL